MLFRILCWKLQISLIGLGIVEPVPCGNPDQGSGTQATMTQMGFVYPLKRIHEIEKS